MLTNQARQTENLVVLQGAPNARPEVGYGIESFQPTDAIDQ